MSKVTAPCLSFQAQGAIGKHLIFEHWKGIKLVRKYFRPANPRTPAQVAHRALYAAAVNAWRTFLTADIVRTAWNLAAKASRRPLTGYHLAISSLVRILKIDPSASYVHTVFDIGWPNIFFSFQNMDTGDRGNESGLFDIWLGDSPRSLSLFESTAIMYGDIEVILGGSPVQTVYAKIRKDGQDRSGIHKFTL